MIATSFCCPGLHTGALAYPYACVPGDQYKILAPTHSTAM